VSGSSVGDSKLPDKQRKIFSGLGDDCKISGRRRKLREEVAASVTTEVELWEVYSVTEETPLNLVHVMDWVS
jgi:hypothetical protein